MRKALFILPCAAMLIASDAGAIDSAACCLQSTSKLDAIMNPVTGGDERFLLGSSYPPNVVLLIGNHDTMQKYPARLPAGNGTHREDVLSSDSTGCDDDSTAVDSTWFNLATDGAANYDSAYSNEFDPNMYYVTFSDQMLLETSGSPAARQIGIYADFRGFHGFSAEAVCGRASDGKDSNLKKLVSDFPKFPDWTNAGVATDCQKCLSSKGWFRGPEMGGNRGFAWAVSGRLLNKYPPKFAIARKVAREVITGAGRIRLGIASLTSSNDLFDPAQFLGAGGSGGFMKPSCSKALDTETSASGFNEGRSDLTNALSNLTYDIRDNGLGEALFSLGAYFSSQVRAEGDVWTKWFSSVPLVLSSYSNPTTLTYGGNHYPNTGGTDWSGGSKTWLCASASDHCNTPMQFEGSDDSHWSVCSPCQTGAIIILADATPDYDNTVPVTKIDELVGTPIDPAKEYPTGNPGGINTCVHHCGCKGVFPNYAFKADGTADTSATCSACVATCDTGSLPVGANRGNRNFMDDVAYFLAHKDLRTDPASTGEQVVYTYTVGFGAGSDPMLQGIAEAGLGKFYQPNNAQELQDALKAAIADVVKRSVSVSTAAVTPVQSMETSAATVLPRLRPEKTGSPWTGELYRFRIFNEFVENEEAPFEVEEPDAGRDKSDIYVIDADEKQVVTDTSGRFVEKDSSPLVEAKPYWEAGDKLRALGHVARKIWTAVSADADGVLTASGNPKEFALANLDDLAPYLGVAGAKDATGNPYCPTVSAGIVTPNAILTKIGLSPTAAMDAINAVVSNPVTLSPTPTQPELDRLCAAVIIQYVRGQDLANETGDRSGTRNSILGDIFHSSPVIVTPPVDPFLCNLGLSNQCVRTLYSEELGTTRPTFLETYSEQECDGSPVTRNAYESYAWKNRARDRLVLVGANDGMVHAFFDGSGSEVCDHGKPVISYPPDEGSTADVTWGNEKWAFIPPDLLPRLVDLIFGHTYLVDGDIMVRDIWYDDNHDGEKQKTEFRTIAIVAEGRGGTHYIGLEILFQSDSHVEDHPGFRWIFPQPCSLESEEFGKTILALSPKPPPVGPVLINVDASLSPGVTDRPTSPVVRKVPRSDESGVDSLSTQEQWVAMLSGGWTPTLGKGRGVYMVDAYAGTVNGRKDNLWWKFEFAPDASGEMHAPKKNLTHSIVAPIAMIDFGPSAKPALDGFFDTAIVGDTRGQIWTMRFFQPGKVDNTTKLVNNWSGARIFEQDRTGGDSIAKRWPFWYLASTALQTDDNRLRVFLGAGDRYNLLDKHAGACGFFNPTACSKYGCTVNTTYQIDKTEADVTSDLMQWGARTFSSSTGAGFQYTPQNIQACGTGPSTTAVTAGYSQFNLRCSGSLNIPNLVGAAATCGQDASSRFFCNRTDTASSSDYSDKIGGKAPAPTSAALGGLGYPSFYGVWAYGEKSIRTGDRFFAEDSDASTASANRFDGVRLSDADLANSTSTTCTVTGCTGPMGAADGNGWYLEYHDAEPPTAASLSHKTATGAATIASCVLWSSAFPGTSPSSCGAAEGTRSRSYQADFITGAPNCAYSFLTGTQYARFKERDVIAPPPEPATVVQISKTGQIRYSTFLMDPSKDQVTKFDINASSEVFQSIYEIPVSKAMHNCRHVLDGGYCSAQAP